jgi:hypothetical protein
MALSMVDSQPAQEVQSREHFPHLTLPSGSCSPTAKELASLVGSSPAVANGYVYIGAYGDNVYCLNATTGAKVWNYTTGDPVYSSPAVANGYVYIGSADDNVYVFGAAQVVLQNATLSIKASVASVTPGQTVTLSGTISPSASGTVTLSQSVNGSAFQQIATPTLTNGTYSYQYTIPGLGTYAFQTSFAGNSQLNPAQSSAVTVSSAKTTAADYTWFIVGAVIILVIIILAAYYITAMRPKTKPAK